MINPASLKKIKDTISEFFEKSTFGVRIDFLPPQESSLPVDIETSEPQILIGEKGQTMIDIQHLLKAMLKRSISEEFYIDLDINGYKKKKMEYLKELARSVADEVALIQKEKSLPSMAAYERRVVHMELADRGDVTTESVGMEPERRIIIKPYP